MRPRTLRSRLVLFFVGLLCLAEATVFVLVDRAASRISHQEVDSGLRAGEAVFRRLLEQDRLQLERAGELLAADFAFREAVATRDVPTLLSVLVNHGRRIGARALMLVDLNGQVIADTLHPGAPARAFPLTALLQAAERAETHGASGMAELPGAGLFQVAVLPVMAPDLIAHVAIGFPVDDAFARRLKAMTALDVSFVSAGKGQGRRVLASTLPGPAASDLAGALDQDSGAEDGTRRFGLGGAVFLGRVASLDTASRVPVVATLHRSVADAMEPFDKLRVALVAVACLTLAVSVGGSVLLARRVAVPLQALAAFAQRVRGGDYATPAPIAGPEEIEALAGSLDHMREGIAQREEEIRRLAYQDALTGLPNRALFQDRVEQALRLARREAARACVLTMDIDRFKHINDALGHQVGDQVLQAVAQRLAASMRECDTVARLGGDEFAVLLPGVDGHAASEVARRIAAVLEEPIRLAGHTIDVAASIGGALFPEHSDDLTGLLRGADIAMYAAKRARVGFALYDPAVEQTREGHLSLLSELRRAVEHDELELRFQPKVALRTGALESAEVLIRWSHPLRGLLPPSEFIPFAEHTGYIREVTRWLIEAAARQSGAWRSQGRDIRLSINVSARDLLDPDLPGTVARALHAHGVPPDLVCLEVTETALMEDPQRAQSTARRLRELGLHLSIDDYGTGFSSLAYIKGLAVNELKIDRAFVRDLVRDDDDLAIVRSTIELGHNLGLQVVAEGVEDESTASRLRELGCDIAQGYHFGRPMQAHELLRWAPARPAKDGGRRSEASVPTGEAWTTRRA